MLPVTLEDQGSEYVWVHAKGRDREMLYIGQVPGAETKGADGKSFMGLMKKKDLIQKQVDTHCKMDSFPIPSVI